MAKKTETKTDKIEKEYVIPLRKGWTKVPRYKRANKAVKSIKEFLARHMKVRDHDLNKIKLDTYINEFIWERGIRKPPVKIKVRAFKEGEIVRAELSELPEKFRFKKSKLEKRERKTEESVKKKKTEEMKEAEEKKEEKKGEEKTEKKEEKSEETKEEKKKEEKEKKSAVVEAGKKLEKESARKSKHMVKIKTKKSKHQRRMALQK